MGPIETTRTALLAACMAFFIGEGAVSAAEAPKPAAAPAVSTKTTPGSPVTIEEMYPASSLRNPFLKIEGGAGKDAGLLGSTGIVPPEEFSIHGLVLKGVMDDRSGGFAILVDPKYGASFVLKKGKLFDIKNKRVPNVTGTVKAKQKTVELVGYDGERQTLIMAEPKEDSAGPAAGAATDGAAPPGSSGGSGSSSSGSPSSSSPSGGASSAPSAPASGGSGDSAPPPPR